MGVARTTPLVYRYAPKILNVLGLPHLYVEQGCQHIKTLISHIHTWTKLGNMMISQLEACSIELGTSTHIFKLDFKTWEKLLTSCWMKHIWCFIHRYNIRIVGQYDNPKLCRRKDFELMNLVINRIG